MNQTFAEEYADLITFAYYCSNFSLTVVAFIFGTCFLRYRDRKYQKSKEDEEGRNHQRREWRKFAERINKDYSKLRRKRILENILKVKKTFEDLKVHSKVTGLDVLRYWLADDRHRNVWSESPQLRALREDLHTIFLQLNFCSSLIHLGEVPKNITEELRYVVEELGNVAKPFLSDEKLEVALTCLEHFVGDKPDAKPKREELDKLFKKIVPYVNSLKFGDDDGREPHYSQCIKFSFNASIPNNINCLFLENLHDILENEKCKTSLVRNIKDQLAESPFKLIDCISDEDSDEVVLAKVQHEVRYYIHYLQENQPLTKIDGINVAGNMERLRQLCEEMIDPSLPKKAVTMFLKRCIGDLEQIVDKPGEHLCNYTFLGEFQALWESKVKEMFINRSQQNSNDRENSEVNPNRESTRL